MKYFFKGSSHTGKVEKNSVDVAQQPSTQVVWLLSGLNATSFNFVAFVHIRSGFLVPQDSEISDDDLKTKTISYDVAGSPDSIREGELSGFISPQLYKRR